MCVELLGGWADHLRKQNSNWVNTDIYECTSQADYARAWNRFVNYICFYAHIDGDTDKVSGYSDYYDVYMNGPVYAETDDEAEPYVDEVVKIAANNGAQIQF